MKYSEIILRELLDGDKELKYSNVKANKEIKEILEDIGVPASVAPYIDFSSAENGGGKCILDSINLNNYKDYFDKEEFKEIEEDFEQYIKLANTNNGDIIAVDYNSEIVCINHESLDETYINISLEKFLLCIYVYFKFIEDTKVKFGDDVFIEDVLEVEDVDVLKNNMLEVDDTSLKDGSFWSGEIEQIIEEINDR